MLLLLLLLLKTYIQTVDMKEKMHCDIQLENDCSCMNRLMSGGISNINKHLKPKTCHLIK